MEGGRLTINRQKTQYLRFCVGDIEGQIGLFRERLGRMKEFRCLGSFVIKIAGLE